MTHTDRFAVLAVGGTDAPASRPDLQEAICWYGKLSGGRWEPCPTFLPPVLLPHSTRLYSATARGLSPNGPNSRNLVADIVATLSNRTKQMLAEAGGKLAIAVPDGFRAHVWYPSSGGISLGGGQWCTRFAVIPRSAPLGTVVHELAHLLLDWPDGEPGARHRCLMAMGGHNGDGKAPAAPAAPLLLGQNWRTPLELTPQLTVEQLRSARQAVGTTDWCGHKIVVEIRGDRLLTWKGPMNRPHLIDDQSVMNTGQTPVLGSIAQKLRRLMPSQKPRPSHGGKIEQCAANPAP